jgi:hypothetical protein
MNRAHPAFKLISQEQLAANWPDAFEPERCEFIVSDTPTVICNLLRVILVGEIPTRGLTIDVYSHGFVETNDEEILPPVIAENIAHIPISQDCPVSAVFSLDVANNSESERMNVYTRHFTATYAGKAPSGKMMNSNIIVAVLAPGKYLRIPRMTIKTDMSSKKGGAPYIIATNPSSVPLDDQDSKIGLADPRKTRVRFNTRGTAGAKAIVRMACDRGLEQIEHILALAPNIKASSAGEATEYILEIDDSYPAAGATIIKYANLLYPDLEFIGQEYAPPIRLLTMRFKSRIPAGTILENVCAKISEALKIIRSAFA